MKLALIIALVFAFALSASGYEYEKRGDWMEKRLSYHPHGFHSHYRGYGRYGRYGYPRYRNYYRNYWRHNNYYYKRDATETMPRLNRTECVYTVDNRMVSCQGPRDVVECETELTWTYPVQFELFGLSRSEEGYYRTYPRRLDNSGWEDNNLMYNGELVYTRMYYANETTGLGLRVLDKECFNRLDEVLNSSLRNEEVYYQNVDREYETTHLRGDLVVVESAEFEEEETEEKTKRWFPYGYYGRYHGFYRRPFFGRYPYYRRYYWKRSGFPVVDTEFMPTN